MLRFYKEETEHYRASGKCLNATTILEAWRVFNSSSIIIQIHWTEVACSFTRATELSLLFYNMFTTTKSSTLFSLHRTTNTYASSIPKFWNIVSMKEPRSPGYKGLGLTHPQRSLSVSCSSRSEHGSKKSSTQVPCDFVSVFVDFLFHEKNSC